MSEEAAYYNALAIDAEGNYRKLEKLRAKCGSWRKAWDETSSKRISPDQEARKLQKMGISLVLQDDADFPPLLKEIPLPPFGIYAKGRLASGTFALAIVGTRKATEEGLSCARFFAKTLAESGTHIISGLSIGIDGAAHGGALDGEGITIGVLANGLDRMYPSMHGKLAERILQKNGAIISEYPIGTPPLPHRFLERNRIVSGLAVGVLIIEAPKRSGTLATARHAMEQNRELFVVPGPISHPNFIGSHSLIKNGAMLVTEPQDIAGALGITLKSARTDFAVSEEGKRIISALETSTRPLTVDKIIELTHLQAREVNKILTNLLLSRAVEETSRGYVLALK